LSSKPHQKKRSPFTEKRKKNTTQSLELTQEWIWVACEVTQTLKGTQKQIWMMSEATPNSESYSETDMGGS
jgi:hypothetical protein